MEEKEVKEEKVKLSYEQLEQAAVQLQQRCLIAEAKLNSINAATVRLEYLFRVLDKSTFFPEDFVKACAEEIVDIVKPVEEKKPE